MATRVAGLVLALSCITILITTVDFVSTVATFTGGDEAPVADRAAWSKTVYERMARAWTFEVIAMGLLAIAALILSERKSRPGWLMAAVGALITMPQYGLLRAGRGAIFEGDEINLDLLTTINGVAEEIFYLGQSFMMFGLGLVFILELAQSKSVLPRWLFGLGGVFASVSGTAFMLVYLGLVGTWMYAGLSGLATLATTAVLGAGLVFVARASD